MNDIDTMTMHDAKSGKNKRLILIASPPACGKTTLAKKLALALGNVAYVDKDVLNPFGRQICRLCGQNYDPDSDFFKAEVRETEYEVTMAMAYEALEFADTVIVNAPFGKEIRDAEYMRGVRDVADRRGAKTLLVFIMADAEICRARMAKRNDLRDAYKLENWEEYVTGVDFSAPSELEGVIELFLYRNHTKAADEQSFCALLDRLSR